MVIDPAVRSMCPYNPSGITPLWPGAICIPISGGDNLHVKRLYAAEDLVAGFVSVSVLPEAAAVASFLLLVVSLEEGGRDLSA